MSESLKEFIERDRARKLAHHNSPEGQAEHKAQVEANSIKWEEEKAAQARWEAANPGGDDPEEEDEEEDEDDCT